MVDDHALPPSALGSASAPVDQPEQAPRLPVCDGRRHPLLAEVGPHGLPDLGEPWLHGWYVCPPLLGGCGSFFQLILTNAHSPRDLARMSYWMDRATRGTEGAEALAQLRAAEEQPPHVRQESAALNRPEPGEG